VLTQLSGLGYTTFFHQTAGEKFLRCGKTNQRSTMKNVKKIAVSLFILGGMTGFHRSGTHHHDPSQTQR